MAFVKVRPGRSVSRHGQTYREGQVFELPDTVRVADLSHLVVETDPDGNERVAPRALGPELSRLQPHERITILHTEERRLAEALSRVRKQISELSHKPATEPQSVTEDHNR